METNLFVTSVLKHFGFLETIFKYEIFAKKENDNSSYVLYGNPIAKRGIYFEYNLHDDFVDIIFLKYSGKSIGLDNFELQLKFKEVLNSFGETTNSIYSYNFNFEKALTNSAYYMKKLCTSIINGTQWMTVEDKNDNERTGYRLFDAKTHKWEKFDSLAEFNKRLDELRL